MHAARRQPEKPGTRPAPAPDVRAQAETRPMRRVDQAPAAVMVLAPVVGLLIWVGIFALIF